MFLSTLLWLTSHIPNNQESFFSRSTRKTLPSLPSHENMANQVSRRSIMFSNARLSFQRSFLGSTAYGCSMRTLGHTSHREVPSHPTPSNLLPFHFSLIAHYSERKKKKKKNPKPNLQNLEKILTLARVVKPTSVNWEHLATSNILLKKKKKVNVKPLFPENWVY